MNKRTWMLIIVSLLLVFALSCSLLESSTPEPTAEVATEEVTEEPAEVETEESTAESEPAPTSTPRPKATREAADGPKPEATGISLELVNESGYALTELYISPVESSEWGANWLDTEVGDGESRMISDIPEDVYDLKAANPDAEVSETLYNVALSDGDTWTVLGTASVSENASLRFEDDFSDNRNDWGGTQDGDVNYREPANGEYCIDIGVDQMTAWEWYEPFRTQEYFAEVKCTVDPTTDASCGIGFGPDGDNLIWYEIDAAAQSYALFLLENDEWQDALVSWIGDQHISPDGENYLGLGQLDDTIYLYVNGILIDSVDTPSFDDGRIGIGGATYEDPNVTVCLDELRVWEIDNTSGAAPAETTAPEATAEVEATQEPEATEEAVAGNSPLEVVWEGPMGYEGREDQSQWCEMKMSYRNTSGSTVNWPDYQPLFLIRNGDGSEDGWYYGSYYHKEDGWPNGIEGDPPPIAPNNSANWTWYSATDVGGQYCAAVAVEYQGWIYQATYGPQGALLDTQVIAP